MKFVCDNCKAKYQIGDDKVAGKTVRMKCRKCGYNIKVAPGGPDSPSMDAPDAPADAASLGPQATPIPAPAPSHVRAPVPSPSPTSPAAHAAPLAARAAWTEEEDESTSIMNAPVRDAVLAATGHLAARPAPPAPRPVTAAAHPPRPVTAAPRSMTPAPTAAPSPGLAGRAPPGRTVPGVGGRHDAPAPPPRPVTRSLSTPALAAAHDAPEMEWYVGIGGTPIGPVRLDVIRDRAAAHEVDGDSLVWREGMPEWRPLRTVPELIEVVTAAQAPRPAPTPTPLAAAPAPASIAPAPAPVAPAPAPAPLAAAPAPAPTPAPLVVGDPFGAGPARVDAPLVTPSSAPSNGSNGKSNGFHHTNGLDAALGTMGALATPAPHSAPEPAPSAPKVSTVDIDPRLEEKLVPRRSNTHPMAYAFIAAAMAFAGVAAYVLLIKPPPQKEVVYVTVPGAPVPVASSATPADKGPQVEVGELTTAPSGHPVAHLGGPMPKSTSTAAAGSTAPASPIDTSGFVSNGPGPSANGPSGANAGGGTLSSGEIQGVVAQNQAMMRRKCWQPAMEASAPNAGAARVIGNVTIGPSGSVESAGASGAEKDYPGLSSCIAARMKNWHFPPSGGSQSVNVPFTFVRQ